MTLNSTDGQEDLPRYFARVFAMAQEMQRGRIDFVLPDGRRFRAEGKLPGPVTRNCTFTTMTCSRDSSARAILAFQ